MSAADLVSSFLTIEFYAGAMTGVALTKTIKSVFQDYWQRKVLGTDQTTTDSETET